MFLKSKSLLIAALMILGFSAQAQKITVLSAGQYRLVTGSKNLCTDFSVSEKANSAKAIAIGVRYTYENVNSTHNTQSDIDEDCEFRERNQREDRTQEVVLTRTNEEFCKGNRVSSTLSKATITPNEIQVRHEVDGLAYSCVWKKQEAK